VIKTKVIHMTCRGSTAVIKIQNHSTICIFNKKESTKKILINIRITNTRVMVKTKIIIV